MSQKHTASTNSFSSLPGASLRGSKVHRLRGDDFCFQQLSVNRLIRNPGVIRHLSKKFLYKSRHHLHQLSSQIRLHFFQKFLAVGIDEEIQRRHCQTKVMFVIFNNFIIIKFFQRFFILFLILLFYCRTIIVLLELSKFLFYSLKQYENYTKKKKKIATYSICYWYRAHFRLPS